MSQLTVLLLILTPAGTALATAAAQVVPPTPMVTATCSGSRPRLLGLATRPLTLPEMVQALEEGCLALDVRFRPDQDTIASISPARFAEVARALGLAQGSYRVAVPPERTPGLWPDTVQARRRSIRLRDELVHYGASPSRLRADNESSITMAEAAPGAAVPMLIRIPQS